MVQDRIPVQIAFIPNQKVVDKELQGNFRSFSLLGTENRIDDLLAVGAVNHFVLFQDLARLIV